MAIVSDEQVIKALRQYNPWWRTSAAVKEESKPQKRLAYYEALKMLKHKSIRRFSILSGVSRDLLLERRTEVLKVMTLDYTFERH